jgi:hypothetical protein
MKTFTLPILAIALIGVISCSTIQSVQPTITAVTPGITKLVDLGLAISGNGAIVPLNDLGSAALQAAQQAAVSKAVTPALSTPITPVK